MDRFVRSMRGQRVATKSGKHIKKIHQPDGRFTYAEVD